VLRPASGGALTPRPVVDISLGGLELAPAECLLDTGALRTRMSAELAALAGIELPADLTEEFYIGGVKTEGVLSHVTLTVTNATDEFSWDAPVVLRSVASASRPGARGLLAALPRGDQRLPGIPGD
jgi:hypothetical protein